ncbi:MAG: hypothetical protein ACYDH2_04730 [Anaerolineaceae bacterium]
MKAIHWLRSRQEENELGYWLSFVAYDQQDRSLINKAYLLYLVIFFFFWFMTVFFFFAKVGGMALSLLNPDQAANTAVTIIWFILACWNLFGLIKSSRRSPIVFSETDQVLVCQTPVNRRALVMRWLWMPWFKNALLFWVLALILGFSTAELHFAGEASSDAIFRYVGFGIRTLLQMIPIHLAFYAFQWSVGVLRLRKNDQMNWIMFPAIALGLIPPGIFLSNNAFYSLFGWTPLTLFMNPGYISGTSSPSLLFGNFSALLMLVLLFSVSRYFNLNRAAQETSELELLTTAAKYGFTDLVEQRRLQNRLSNKRKFTLPAKYKGSAALTWKNRIQATRGWNWKQIFPLVTFFSITMGLPLIPGFLSKLLVVFFLVQQIGPIMTLRLRSDLACWPILQQLPIRKSHILIRDLVSSLPLLFTVGLLGFAFSALISKTFALTFFFILPGLLTIIGCTAAIDILRKSKSDLLINGNVPSVGTQGIILGVIGSIIPVWLASTFTGLIGIFFSTLISLAITWICYKLAVYAFKNIK